ncbi:hypothetical protein E2562_021950 [Oryza meyeriana var. granulata]|uniref:Uncharacterized protein n=1 Tax=Oryza meyeriana var. granulata TaxID=110450 RepID=A0A6G1DLE8_9ORYZ|nr:hypothetical protein E2562_021950 [Oryza meyeriana var. granulata]
MSSSMPPSPFQQLLTSILCHKSLLLVVLATDGSRKPQPLGATLSFRHSASWKWNWEQPLGDKLIHGDGPTISWK